MILRSTFQPPTRASLIMTFFSIACIRQTQASSVGLPEQYHSTAAASLNSDARIDLPRWYYGLSVALIRGSQKAARCIAGRFQCWQGESLGQSQLACSSRYFPQLHDFAGNSLLSDIRWPRCMPMVRCAGGAGMNEISRNCLSWASNVAIDGYGQEQWIALSSTLLF